MVEYVNELDGLIDKVVKIVEEFKSEGKNTNITKVIRRIKEKNICDTTLARDVIIWAACKGRLTIKRVPPNQLVLDTPQNGGEKR
mgnify:CR=1 FL=1